MEPLVRRTVPLGAPPWPTVDPFLFCVHHRDAYPRANPRCGPDAVLDGRPLGQDFGNVDGWNMYHGTDVPGFPQHPHRGFETITYVRRGLVDHADSLGATARYGRGDVQWMTAGRGIVHAEMFPLLDVAGPNPLELFQIWINLPASDKFVQPHFSMLWDAEIPRLPVEGDGQITVIAGRLRDHSPPAPPPSSWAARPDSDVALWHVSLGAGAETVLPPGERNDSVRVLYLFDGDGAVIGDTEVGSSTAVEVHADRPLPIRARGTGVEALLMQGRPIAEPVAQYGPFVMNSRDEIAQAFDDYQRTRFGGWPWDRDDPTHDRDPARFARHADGHVERAAS